MQHLHNRPQVLSVVSKPLTVTPNLLDATLTKNRGRASPGIDVILPPPRKSSPANRHRLAFDQNPHTAQSRETRNALTNARLRIGRNTAAARQTPAVLDARCCAGWKKSSPRRFAVPRDETPPLAQ